MSSNGGPAGLRPASGNEQASLEELLLSGSFVETMAAHALAVSYHRPSAARTDGSDGGASAALGRDAIEPVQSSLPEVSGCARSVGTNCIVSEGGPCESAGTACPTAPACPSANCAQSVRGWCNVSDQPGCAEPSVGCPPTNGCSPTDDGAGGCYSDAACQSDSCQTQDCQSDGCQSDSCQTDACQTQECQTDDCRSDACQSDACQTDTCQTVDCQTTDCQTADCSRSEDCGGGPDPDPGPGPSPDPMKPDTGREKATPDDREKHGPTYAPGAEPVLPKRDKT